MEEENQYLLVIMTSISQLSLGSVGDNLRELSAAPPGGNTFWNPCMAAVLSGSTKAVSYPGAHHEEAGGVMQKMGLVSKLMTTFG